MNQALNSNSPVNEASLSLVSEIKPTFKYTLYLNSEDEALLETNSWNAVLKYLKDEPAFMREGEALYGRERETRWDDEQCIEFIEENAQDVLHWSNYRIEEKKI